jgi:hypothetical protein
MRAGAIAAIVVGIVLAIIGIVVAAVFAGSADGLGAGIAVLIVGIVVAVIGGAVGSSRGSRQVTPAPTTMGAPASPGGDEMMVSMVRMLAQAPEAQRREMIKTRLASFDRLGDAERAKAMRGMMAATRVLDPEGLKRLTTTRLESLAEDFDLTSRKRLMETHMMVLMGMPKEAMISDMSAMVAAMGQCHEACKMKDMATMKEVMMGIPAERRAMLMQMMPAEIRSMLMG